MANKRTLKQTINLVSEELLAEAVAASLYGNEKHTDNTDALLASIIKMRCDYISRVSHPEPGLSARTFFRDLRSGFAAQLSELADQIDNL